MVRGSNRVEILTLFALNPDYAGSRIVPLKGSNPPTNRAAFVRMSQHLDILNLHECEITSQQILVKGEYGSEELLAVATTVAKDGFVVGASTTTNCLPDWQ